MRRQGAVALLTLLILQWALSTHVSAQTIIIPALSVAERYDSNIYNTPTSLLSPGIQPEDFATVVAPQLIIAQAGSLVRGSIFGTGLATKYLNNPDRDFIGWNSGGQLNFTDAAHQVSQRITSLVVRGTYRSTPASTGFGAAGGGLNTGFGSPAGGALNSGIVTNRASRQMYNLALASGYQLTGVTTLHGSFLYQRISFGGQQGGANNPLFDTTGYQGITGISTRLSARDTVGANATMSHFVQEQSSGGSGQGSYTTIGETLNWTRLWTQELTTFLSGGANFKLPVGSDIPGQSQALQVRPNVTARMTYTSYSEELREAGSSQGPFDDYNSPSLASSMGLGGGLGGGPGGLAGGLAPGGIMARGAYSATMAYRFTLVPGYAFTAGPQEAHVLALSARGGITSKLTGIVGMNYAHRSTLGEASSTADTVGVSVGAQYLLGPVLASLTTNWLYVSNSTPQTPEYEFSKKIVMLSFSYAFASPVFFRMGEFGSTGTQGSDENISAPSGAGTGSRPSGEGSEF
ncbi:MAG TPA: hypothetical protein VK901_06330 [Nitrospiraceae bacterium]|nr:hypothetical protein [Nitrospiraceae bacterium]